MATKSVPSTAAWRLWLVLLALALLMALLIWRLLTLQVLDTERGYAFLQGQGKARTVRSEVIPAHRGQILDRNGLPLAISTPVATLWANPRELADARADWPRLAGALDLPPEQLSRRIQRNAGREFMYLARHLAPEEAERIMALQLPGVYLRNEYRRFYPAGEVLAQLVGITNVDDQGQEGLELAYDHWLAGSPGRKQVLKNLRGQVVRELGESVPARPGQDLQLAIDLRLQYLAYRELKAALVRHQARSGSIVMLDSQSGEVLAMVNQPSFNPNNRRQYRPEAARNRAVTDLMEPGSTVKPMTLVAALESGRYSLDSTVDTSPGHLRVGGKTLLDPVNYGELDLAHVLAKSSQVGISKIALSLQPEDLWEVFSRFGLGQLTDSGFPGEQPGLLLNRPRWQPIEQATLSFGYGLSVTPLQLARAYAVFAAEGQWRPVSMLRVTAPPEGRQVIAPAIAGQVSRMLKAVTEPGGTGTRAALPTYSVAGKTGTAHKVGAGGYADSRYVSVFAGFAPASEPRVVTVVVIDEPGGGLYHGGQVAAPLFARVTGEALRLLSVAPDRMLVAEHDRQGGAAG